MSPSIVVNHVAIGCFLVLVLTAAIGDLRTYRIPNSITVAILLLFPVFALTSPVPVDWVVTLAIAGAVFAAGLALFAFGRFGGGDVKLLVGCVLWAGPALAVDFLILTALAGGALSLFMISPLGRGLAVAASNRGLTGVRDFLMADVIPYGAAIAAGGAYVAVALMTR